MVIQLDSQPDRLEDYETDVNSLDDGPSYKNGTFSRLLQKAPLITIVCSDIDHLTECIELRQPCIFPSRENDFIFLSNDIDITQI